MKKNLKRVIALLAISTLAVGMLAGCGSSNSEEKEEKEEEKLEEEETKEEEKEEIAEEKEELDEEEGKEKAAEKEEEKAEKEEEKVEATEEKLEEMEAQGEYKIAFCMLFSSNSFQTKLRQGVEDECEKLGVDCTIYSAEYDVATQISQIEQCVSEKYDAILYTPVEPDALQDVTKEAADAGVIMICIDTALNDWEEYGVAALSIGNNVEAGKMEMEHVAELIGGEGQIAILWGPMGANNAIERYEGYTEALEEYPDIEIVAEADCEWDTASAMNTAEAWLAAYDLDAIVSQNDGMAVGAANAAQGAGVDIVITGVDADEDGLEAIEEGRMTGTIMQDGVEQGENAVIAAVTLLNGGELPTREIMCEPVWIDASNLSEAQ